MYTVDSTNKIAEALVTGDFFIVYVGDIQAVQAFFDKNIKVI